MTDLNRRKIIDALAAALKPLDYVLAFWEAGSASFQRADQWSDIDLYVVSDDDQVESTLRILESAGARLAEFDLQFRIPEPAWHGHSQVFWRLKNTSPFLFLDIVVMKSSSPDKFLQYAIHGKPIVYFDKAGIVKDDPVNAADLINKIRRRLDTLKITFPLFQVLVLKELNRGHDIEALGFYLAATLRPLVEVLNIKYRPLHYGFHTTYAPYELPDAVVGKLRNLCFIRDKEHLKQCRDEAEKWFWETLNGIDPEALKVDAIF
jgi:predicted nucleotidyltransferase